MLTFDIVCLKFMSTNNDKINLIGVIKLFAVSCDIKLCFILKNIANAVLAIAITCSFKY